MSKVPLTIYLDFQHANEISEAARAARSSQSAWVVAQLKRDVECTADLAAELATNQLCRLLATTEIALEMLAPNQMDLVAQRVDERTKKYRAVASRRLVQ
ncbi:MAG: hypothetical protein R3E18_07795 [Sphingomonadaceae bacterium]